MHSVSQNSLFVGCWGCGRNQPAGAWPSGSFGSDGKVRPWGKRQARVFLGDNWVLATALGRASSAATRSAVELQRAPRALGTCRGPSHCLQPGQGLAESQGSLGPSALQRSVGAVLFSGPLSLATRVHLEPVCILFPNKQLSGRVNKLISWEKNLLRRQRCL